MGQNREAVFANLYRDTILLRERGSRDCCSRSCGDRRGIAVLSEGKNRGCGRLSSFRSRILINTGGSDAASGICGEI